MRKLGESVLAHAVACCGIASSGARRREGGNVAPRPAADAAGCKKNRRSAAPLAFTIVNKSFIRLK